MLGPNLASILVYLCSLMSFRSFLVGTHDSFCRFLKYIKFLVETRQSGFPELRPLSQTIGNAINFRFFWKKES